ncbi:MAG: methyl-accepting chemotaxis protein [Spirochaetes bacterium]|nr:methyl-accepting chemotaxis protein [Spirochaetota bacterium]
MNRQRKSKNLIIKISAAVYLNLFLFLIFSEYINSFFNNKFDSEGIPLTARITLSFKPSVMVLTAIFTSIICYRVIRYLKPLFQFIKSGNNYDKARIVAIRIPWMIINFEIISWALGTTVYYIIKGGHPDSGIPFIFGLTLKVVTGLLSAVYAAFSINLILKEAKQSLKITDIREGENDKFSRYKDTIAAAASSSYIVVNFSYIAYYFSQSTAVQSLGEYLLMIIPFGTAIFLTGTIPIFLSKLEYKFQINSLMRELKGLASKDSSLSEEIYLINFDELGEMAVYVNLILKRFNEFVNKIRTVVDQLSGSAISLSSVGEQSSSVSNQQAASVAEITSTMEDSDRLSKSIGNLAMDVLEKSMRTQDFVKEGNNTIEEHIASSESVKKANENTIEFIRTLNEDIKAIWEVVTIINSIAEQVKIIAFNAELEASAAGEAGKNFEIVASEIRRLADNTVASTTEIRNKISIIEKAGHGLLSASNDATDLIHHGWEISRKAGKLFNEISNSSAESTSSAKSIEEKIRMQIQGFEQILIAMKQISQGASDFADSVQTSSSTAADLAELVESLKILADSSKSQR